MAEPATSILKMKDLFLKLKDLILKMKDPSLNFQDSILKMRDLFLKLEDLILKMKDPSLNFQDSILKMRDLPQVARFDPQHEGSFPQVTTDTGVNPFFVPQDDRIEAGPLSNLNPENHCPDRD